MLVSVDRGDQTLAQVGISVDGEIVDYQSFGGGMMMAPAEDEPAEQAAAVFTLSFDSDEYDETGDRQVHERGSRADGGDPCRR